MRCTAKKTFEIVTGQGNQMIAQVKANQEALLSAVQQATHAVPLSQTSQFDHARSRIERREIKVFAAAPLLAALPEPDGWAPLIKAVVQVYRHTDGFDTRSGDWRLRTETAYYVATELRSAEVFAEAIRGHWGIENRQHYVRDVTLKEDASRIRCNPGIFARLRSFTLNILRRNKVINISEALYDNALNLDNLRRYVGVF
jgi:predicted transposase YbfD/YdcC